MILSKTTGYGVRALAYLAGQPEGRLCRLREIAQDEGIPPVYLRKVLGELRRHRLVRSVKGIHGGYELACPPASITLWDVFQILEPDPYLDDCILGCGPCGQRSPCALHDDWEKVRDRIATLLKTRAISDVAAQTRGGACGDASQGGSSLAEPTPPSSGTNRSDRPDDGDANGSSSQEEIKGAEIKGTE